MLSHFYFTQKMYVNFLFVCKAENYTYNGGSEVGTICQIIIGKKVREKKRRRKMKSEKKIRKISYWNHKPIFLVLVYIDLIDTLVIYAVRLHFNPKATSTKTMESYVYEKQHGHSKLNNAAKTEVKQTKKLLQ